MKRRKRARINNIYEIKETERKTQPPRGGIITWFHYKVVRHLATLKGEKRLREFCKNNYWKSKAPRNLAVQTVGIPEMPFHAVRPHCFTGRPSIYFFKIKPNQTEEEFLRDRQRRNKLRVAVFPFVAARKADVDLALATSRRIQESFKDYNRDIHSCSDSEAMNRITMHLKSEYIGIKYWALARNVGYWVEAQDVLAGRLSRRHGIYQLTIRHIDVRSGRTIAEKKYSDADPGKLIRGFNSQHNLIEARDAWERRHYESAGHVSFL